MQKWALCPLLALLREGGAGAERFGDLNAAQSRHEGDFLHDAPDRLHGCGEWAAQTAETEAAGAQAVPHGLFVSYRGKGRFSGLMYALRPHGDG